MQDKTWIQGPDNDWEIYTVLADAPTMQEILTDDGSVCCAPDPLTISATPISVCC